MTENYRKLLAQSDSVKIGLLIFDYYNGSTVATEYVCDSLAGFNTEPTDSIRAHFRPRLQSSLNVSSGMDAGPTYGGVVAQGVGAFVLNNLDGFYDAWRTYSVDGEAVRYLIVGWLRDGTRVGIDEALESPVVETRGVGNLKVGDASAVLEVQGELFKLDAVLNPRTFSPPCLEFPGTLAGCADFGDSWDWTAGARVEEYWIKSSNPTLAGQLVMSKDTGTAGTFLDLGTAGSGALRWTVREQTPSTTDTAAGVVEIGQDHPVAIRWDPATSTRTIFVDRVPVASTTAVAGSPAGNSASYKLGSSFSGTIARPLIWGNRTDADIDRYALWPVLGSETGLVAAPVLEDGEGATAADWKSGSAITGTLGPGVDWVTSTYYGENLAGQHFPFPLGYVQDLPLVLIDPGRQILFAGLHLVAVPEVSSNHAVLDTSQYTVDLDHGIIEVTGSFTGTYSAKVAGPGVFGAAVELDGAAGYASGTVSCPAGTMALAIMVQPNTTEAALRCVAGWTAGGGAGQRLLAFSPTDTNRIRWVVRNDAGTAFTAEWSTPLVRRRYMVVGEVDTTGGSINLKVDGQMVATTPVTGTFNTVATALTIGRNSTSAIQFLPGVVDECSIWNALPDAEALTLAPADSAATGLVHYWPMNERAGSSTLVNAVSGGPSLTLNGVEADGDFQWTHSRITPGDLTHTVATSCGYTVDEFVVETSLGFIRAQKGDSQWLVLGSETGRDVADQILKGVHALLRPQVGTGNLELFQVELPSGEPSEGARFTGDHIYGKSEIEPVTGLGPPAYRIVVLVRRNWTSMTSQEVAGLVLDNPDRFNYATREWRRAPWQNLSIRQRYPQARVIEVESCLLHLEDGMAEAERVGPFYGPEREPYSFTLATSALGVQPGDCMLVRYELRGGGSRLGLGSPGRLFLVLGAEREDYRSVVRGLA